MIAILQIAFLILRLLGRLLGMLIWSPFRRVRVRWVFWRTLRRRGLSFAEAEELTAEYHPGIRIGDVVRAARAQVT